jgi:hypothetical protein
MFFKFLEARIIKGLDSGESGADFATWFTETTSVGQYQELITAGVEGITELIRQQMPVAFAKMQTMPAVAQQFLTQFVSPPADEENSRVPDDRPRIKLDNKKTTAG